jgi:hemoglobin
MPEANGINWDELHPETRRLLSRRRFLAGGARGAAGVVMFGGLLTVAGCGGDDDDDDAASDDSTTDTTAASTTDATAAADSLYTRLGGNAAITAVITDFVGRVGADDRINAFFANTDLDRLTVLLIEFTANATGGPEEYTGRSMVDAHAGLAITVPPFGRNVMEFDHLPDHGACYDGFTSQATGEAETITPDGRMAT